MALSAPATGGAGLSIAVTDTVKNQGGGSTVVSTTMSFYLSTNATLGSGAVLLGTRTVGVLAPNATSPGTTRLIIPAGTAPGQLLPRLAVRTTRRVLEISESNNTKATLIKLSPDLVVRRCAERRHRRRGRHRLRHGDHEESGRRLGGRDDDALLLSTNATFDGSDIPLGSRDVGILLSGTSSSGKTPVRIPVGTPPGKYYILGRADADNRVAESNEGNNVASRAITISAQ